MFDYIKMQNCIETLDIMDVKKANTENTCKYNIFISVFNF